LENYLLLGQGPLVSGPAFPFTTSVGHPDPCRLPRSRSPSDDHAHGSEPAGAGRHQSLPPHVGERPYHREWASLEEPLSIFASSRDHVIPPFTQIISSSATAQLSVEHHHHPPPSPSEWTIGSTIVPSSPCTQLSPKLPASDAGSHRSPHGHLLLRGSPMTTMLCPPLGCPRVPQAPPSSLAILRTEVLLWQPSIRAAVDHLTANRLPHRR
jgi:hypothetical protein